MVTQQELLFKLSGLRREAARRQRIFAIKQVFYSLLVASSLVLGGFGLGFWAGNEPTSSIGGTDVPGNLSCQEDEVIAFSRPNSLACVHFEDVR